MKLLILATLVLLAGCNETPEVSKERGEARIAVFKICMELAAKMPRQADDDVADIVESCSTQAYYQTNYIK